MDTYVSYKVKKKFRHQAFVHIHIPMLFQNQSFYLNIVSVDVETIVSGKKFCTLITLCLKKFSQLKSTVLLVKLHMMEPCVLDWAQGKKPSPFKIVVTVEQKCTKLVSLKQVMIPW